MNAIEASFAIVAELHRLEDELNDEPAGAVRRDPASDQLQPRRDLGRRLAVDGCRRVHALVQDRALPGIAGRRAQGPRRGGGAASRLRKRVSRRASPGRSLRRVRGRGHAARRRRADRRGAVDGLGGSVRDGCSDRRRRPRRPTCERSSARAFPLPASARSPSTCTASTSGFTCRRWCRLRRCSRSSFATGAVSRG